MIKTTKKERKKERKKEGKKERKKERTPLSRSLRLSIQPQCRVSLNDLSVTWVLEEEGRWGVSVVGIIKCFGDQIFTVVWLVEASSATSV